jgi:hypothetical protein
MFKVGDRVRGKGVVDGVDITGMLGRIEDVSKRSNKCFAVGFDTEDEDFHDCDGRCAKNRGYHVTPNNLELVTDEPIRVETDTASDPEPIPASVAPSDETLRLIRHTLLAITASTDPVAARLADQTLSVMESGE